jgi:hypothetical protein
LRLDRWWRACARSRRRLETVSELISVSEMAVVMLQAMAKEIALRVTALKWARR